MAEIQLNVDQIQEQAEGFIAVLETANEELSTIQAERAAALEQITLDAQVARAAVSADMKARADAVAGPAAEASRKLNAWSDIGLIAADDIPSFSMAPTRGGRGTGKKAAVLNFLRENEAEQFTGAEIEEGTGFEGLAQLLQTMIKADEILRTKKDGGHINLYQIA